MWQVDVALMVIDEKGEAGRVEAIQMALPENGFPKGLGMGTLVTPENMVAISWSKDGRSGVMVRADSVKMSRPGRGQAGGRVMAQLIALALSGLCAEGWHLWCPGRTGPKGKGRRPCECGCHGHGCPPGAKAVA